MNLFEESESHLKRLRGESEKRFRFKQINLRKPENCNQGSEPLLAVVFPSAQDTLAAISGRPPAQ